MDYVSRITHHASRYSFQTLPQDTLMKATDLETGPVRSMIRRTRTKGGSNEQTNEHPGASSAGERRFRCVNQVWIDSAWKPENEPVKVKCLSDAHFKLLDRDPALDKVFALGQNVLVVLKSGKAIRVGEEGKEDLTDKELDELFGQK